MRKLITVLTALTVLALPSAAFAAAPLVVEDFTETFSGTIPAGEMCEFEVQLEETIDVRVTVFFNADGSEDRIDAMVHGDTVWSSEYGEVFEHWHVRDSFDPNTLTAMVTGNRWNGHQAGAGIVVNGSGRVLIDVETGDLTFNGPNEEHDGPAALCEALAP